jgi:hypothetical protein
MQGERYNSKHLGKDIPFKGTLTVTYFLQLGSTSKFFTSFQNSTISWGPRLEHISIWGTFHMEAITFCPRLPKALVHLITKNAFNTSPSVPIVLTALSL